MSLNDLLDEIPDAPTPPKKKSVRPRPREFNSALDDMGILETAKVSDRKDGRIAGSYLRKTFTLAPEQIEAIDRLAQEWETSGNDVARWMVDIGLEAAANGRKPTLAKRGWRKVYER